MKVVCVKLFNRVNENDISIFSGTEGLTIGKSYETICDLEHINGIYAIINDFGLIWTYDIEYFEKLEDCRNKKLEELGI